MHDCVAGFVRIHRRRETAQNSHEFRYISKSMEDTAMFNLLWSATRKSLIAFVLLCGLTAGERAFGQAPSGYWDNYWNWYDGTYRPYYQRRQVAVPRGGYAVPGYFGTYGYP